MGYRFGRVGARTCGSRCQNELGDDEYVAVVDVTTRILVDARAVFGRPSAANTWKPTRATPWQSTVSVGTRLLDALVEVYGWYSKLWG